MPLLRPTLVCATVVAAAGVPATAQAALPKFKDESIVVGKSLGGLKIGATQASAKKAWGTGSQCFTAYCQYRVTKDDIASGEGTFSLKSSTVSSIKLTAPAGKFKAPFTTPKTSKGIGIGSTVSAFKKAYPKAKLSGTSSASIKTGATTTYFFFYEGKRILSIEIQKLG